MKGRAVSLLCSADNERFLSLVEDYFAQPTETKMADVRPELSYQVSTRSAAEIWT